MNLSWDKEEELRALPLLRRGRNEPRNKGARGWKKKDRRPVTLLSLPHEGFCLECKSGWEPFFCISNQEAFEKCSC